MSAADTPAPGNQWPAWMRRNSGVELLGPPGRFFARLTIALSFLSLMYVGVWNAQHYPVALGYDAPEHIAYADTLIHKGHMPNAAESGEHRALPGYYLTAGAAAWIGTKLGSPAEAYRGAQYLNLILVLATALVLLSLARAIAPRREEVWAASIAYFAFLPVVAKTSAMFHPETMNMFFSACALRLGTSILKQRRLSVRRLAPLAVALAAGLAVRSSTIFTLVAIVAGLAWTFVPLRARRPSTRQLLTVFGLVLAGVAGWLAVTRTPDLALGLLHPGSRTSVSSRSHFWDLAANDVFRVPFRPNFLNAALPVTYSEIWGDWVGAFSWSSYSQGPWPPALTVMRDQNAIGLLPLLLAVAGWLTLIGKTLRGRRDLAAIAFLPLVAVTGYLYRSYQFLSADGDLLKASYLLTTAPVWSLGFGISFGHLGRRRLVRLGVTACLATFAILELRFMLYGIRDHRPIF